MRLTRLSPVLLLLPALALAQIKWDFEDPELTWRPRSETVTVSRTEGTDATGKGQACLRIAGTQEDGWNYAISDTHPMVAGKLYRLSAWLRVDRLGQGAQAPFLKCEFVSAEPGKGSGRVGTTLYDVARMKQWQELSVEFRAPDWTGGFWLAVEKGANTPMEIEALLDEVVVEPIARFTALDKYNLDPVPTRLEALRGVHPRLYLTSQRVQELRQAVLTTHAPLWQELQSQADGYVKRGAPPYIERDRYSGDEQLWQRDVGNAMPVLAMAWLLTDDAKYLQAAQAWASASCGYPTWGLGRIDGMDLATGHQLLGLGIVYDWCHAGLTPEAKQTIRETILKRGGAMFEAGASGQAWWHRAYLQNHLWVNLCGLSVAGLAVWDEAPEALRWAGLAKEKFERTVQALGPDGASHEGVGYWEYGVENLLKFMALARDLLGTDLYDHDWWRNTADYALYLSLPRRAWTRGNCIVDIADCPRGHWYGPEYLLRHLAHEFQDRHAQWLAAQVDEANVDSACARWLNLVWYDPKIATRPPDDLPTLRHFRDMDIVSARSDWSGDESLVVFKCGPYIGHKAVQEFAYDPGGGHVHPDANHFLLFGHGEWLVRDDGYASKFTGQHNTLLVDGKGQVGEAHWFNGALMLRKPQQPHILKSVSEPEADHIAGDATAAYPDALGLRQFRRHLLFLKPNVLIVLDDILCDEPRLLELRFHPEQQQAERNGNAFICRGKTAALRIEPLTMEGLDGVSGEIVQGQDRSGKELPMFTIRLQAERAHWRHATAFSWSAADQEPVPVRLQLEGHEWVFIAFNKAVAFDWAKEEMTVPKG